MVLPWFRRGSRMVQVQCSCASRPSRKLSVHLTRGSRAAQPWFKRGSRIVRARLWCATRHMQGWRPAPLGPRAPRGGMRLGACPLKYQRRQRRWWSGRDFRGDIPGRASSPGHGRRQDTARSPPDGGRGGPSLGKAAAGTAGMKTAIQNGAARSLLPCKSPRADQ